MQGAKKESGHSSTMANHRARFPSGLHPLSVDVHGEPCTNFVWGDVDGLTFSRLINDAYEEVVHWRRNIFLVPSGTAVSLALLLL